MPKLARRQQQMNTSSLSTPLYNISDIREKGEARLAAAARYKAILLESLRPRARKTKLESLQQRRSWMRHNGNIYSMVVETERKQDLSKYMKIAKNISNTIMKRFSHSPGYIEENSLTSASCSLNDTTVSSIDDHSLDLDGVREIKKKTSENRPFNSETRFAARYKAVLIESLKPSARKAKSIVL